MKRKNFLKSVSLASAGMLLSRSIPAKTIVESCAPVRMVTGTLASVKDGNWSDPSTWGGRLPTAADTPDIKHAVRLDKDASVSGANITGSLSFGAATLASTRNILVTGTLMMRSGTIQFINVNESAMVGGGMDPVDTDTGLWVMGAGRLDLQGTVKQGWTNTNGLDKGATQFTVDDASGWEVGDTLAIAPSAYNDFSGFDEIKITARSGNTITTTPLQFAHPAVASWRPEVINLSRSVRIEGTSSGRAHIFIRSTAVQSIKHTAIRYMGPRKNQGGDTTTELVLGRYGLHFHHCMDSSYGSVVEGCVILDTNNHAYVPHVSNGISFQRNVAYNCKETAFWWDEGHLSHDVVYDGNLVARCEFVPRSLGVDTTSATDPSFGCAAFMLGMGDDCVAKNNVVAGCNTGDPKNGGAYMWQANNEGVWAFENNMAHNCSNGVFIWQNSPLNHVLSGTQIYHCSVAIEHGAYANSYTFRGGKIYASPFHVEASSQDSARVRLENIVFDGAGVIDYSVVVFSSPIPGAYPIFIRSCTFTGHRIAGVVDVAANELKSIDLIQCTAAGTLVVNKGTAQEVIRVQPSGGQVRRITTGGESAIASFAPTVWGAGNGLKAEYLNNSSLQGTPVVSRVDSNIAFQQWSTSLHHRLSATSHSMRWSGKLQAQYTEAYTFTVAANGGVRLWVNGVQIIDKWQEQRSSQLRSTPINLTAGQLYDVRIEYFNSDGITGILLLWECRQLGQELVPQSQLYPGDVVIGQQPPLTSPPPAQPTVNLDVSASPNPTRSNWAIKVSSSAGGRIKLTITNSSGRVMASAEIESGSTTNYGASLAKGNYYLTAEQGSIKKSIQVIKQ